MAAPMDTGEKVYQQNCMSCHQANGEGSSSLPSLVGQGLSIGPIGEHIDIVINGSGQSDAGLHHS